MNTQETWFLQSHGELLSLPGNSLFVTHRMHARPQIKAPLLSAYIYIYKPSFEKCQLPQ